ncbi:MAG: 2-phosphosulfolactate phosphatase [Candidatus Wallbacteria bacterium]|nr:2-phosphosulfolactate phosphatase [Candidatus Wallbacteria bacterium]
MFTSQNTFDVRFDWGLNGVLNVANHGHVAVIVDVLSFSTCVEIACSRGAFILPFQYKDSRAGGSAKNKQAVLAGNRGSGNLSLSPESLLKIEPGTRLVLPSPNGSTISLACTAPVILAGCLRNAGAVAKYAAAAGNPVSVIAAAEQWPDGAVRFAFEDRIGAGAIIHGLPGSRSPEALAAESAYLAAEINLCALLAACASGRELIERGYAEDVKLAADLNVSRCVPLLTAETFINIAIEKSAS